MNIQVALTRQPIAQSVAVPAGIEGNVGAWLEFRGIVRGQESERQIGALEYEAYEPMAISEMKRIAASLATLHPCLAMVVIHRLGIIPVGETALYVGVAARHRGPAINFLSQFIDQLKLDVPIWKTRAIPGDPTPNNNG